MSSLSGLRSLVYAYLGTTASDPAYPAATVNALINAAGNTLIADIHQAKPDYLQATATFGPAAPTSRTYMVPQDYAGWLELRLAPDNGDFQEKRLEELHLYPTGLYFAISGPDNAAALQTGEGSPLGAQLFLRYRSQPAELVADTDQPTWLPTAFHDLIARKAAIDAFGLGNESAPAPLFVASTKDREAQLWVSIGRRGVAPTIQR